MRISVTQYLNISPRTWDNIYMHLCDTMLSLYAFNQTASFLIMKLFFLLSISQPTIPSYGITSNNFHSSLENILADRYHRRIRRPYAYFAKLTRVKFHHADFYRKHCTAYFVFVHVPCEFWIIRDSLELDTLIELPKIMNKYASFSCQFPWKSPGYYLFQRCRGIVWF